MELYGKDWKRRSLEARVGRIDQVGGLRCFQSLDGPGSGAEQIEVRTGGGLSYSILPSRGMDIGLAEFASLPLCWLSPNGDIHPAFYDSRGTGWLRTAFGGLLTTCGLSQVGQVGVNDEAELGLHGRAHHTPSRQVSMESHWEGDEYSMVVQGKVEEASIFGHHLCLTRRITSWLGKNEIDIRDTVENAGFEPAPHMLLYHFNFGFPLLDADTKIKLPSGKVIPREPALPMDGLGDWHPPEAGFKEQVYYHENLSTEEDGTATVIVHKPKMPLLDRPLEVAVSWNTKHLPLMVQWKMHGEGTHVLGIEPANCHVEGRAAERVRGSLVMLAPGQAIDYHLNISIHLK